MCGRFVLFSSVNTISREFAVLPENIVFSPHYNIAPTQEILIVIAEGERRLIKCRWGFIPSWAKDPNIGYKMINARVETLAEKPTFKSAIRKHRCLVVAGGFFEWKKEGNGEKTLYL